MDSNLILQQFSIFSREAVKHNRIGICSLCECVQIRQGAGYQGSRQGGVCSRDHVR